MSLSPINPSRAERRGLVEPLSDRPDPNTAYPEYSPAPFIGTTTLGLSLHQGQAKSDLVAADLEHSEEDRAGDEEQAGEQDGENDGGVGGGGEDYESREDSDFVPPASEPRSTPNSGQSTPTPRARAADGTTTPDGETERIFCPECEDCRHLKGRPFKGLPGLRSHISRIHSKQKWMTTLPNEELLHRSRETKLCKERLEKLKYEGRPVSPL